MIFGQLTALDGDGQQCKAAPACTASTDPEKKGNLDTSALTRARLLQFFCRKSQLYLFLKGDSDLTTMEYSFNDLISYRQQRSLTSYRYFHPS